MASVYAFPSKNRRGEFFYSFRTHAGNIAPKGGYYCGEFYTLTCNETGVVTRHYQAGRRGGGGEAYPQPSFDWLISHGLLDSWQEK